MNISHSTTTIVSLYILHLYCEYFSFRNVLGVHVNMFSASNSDAMAQIHGLSGGMFPSILLDEVDAEIVKNNAAFLEVIQEMGYFILQATKPDTAGT